MPSLTGEGTGVDENMVELKIKNLQESCCERELKREIFVCATKRVHGLFFEIFGLSINAVAINAECENFVFCAPKFITVRCKASKATPV